MNIEDLESIVNAGEAHVIFEEQEAILSAYNINESFIGLRGSNTEFDYDNGQIVVNDGQTKHYLSMDRVVYFTEAKDFPD